eukprot:IDg10140t1
MTIALWSVTLNIAERNYSETENYCLAIVYRMLIFCPYLLGENFDIYTDYACLKWVLEITNPSGRHMR